MIYEQLVVGPLQCNCAILACEKTKEAVIIDPGDEGPRIVSAIRARGLTPKYVLHTHAHFDHVGGSKLLKETFSVPLCLHKADEIIYQNLPLQGRMFGIPLEAGAPIDRFLEDEEEIVFGIHKLQVIHTPGHSPGGICFRILSGKEMLFSGDTLFQQSIGRTDLWGGNTEQLLQAVRDRLFVLEEDLPVHPGHGPSTSVGIEKRTNPFFS